MAQTIDDDFFSDDATLDALPYSELQALEDAAAASTQQQLASSDYGNLDDDASDLWATVVVDPGPPPTPSQILPPPPPTQQHQGLHDTIAALESDREHLQQQLHLRTGEIGIVRSNIARATRDHERAVAALTDLRDEERARHLRAEEGLAGEVERLRTEIAFLKREVEGNGRKGKGANRVLVVKEKEREKEAGGGGSGKVVGGGGSPMTPKKGVGFLLRDGFEDVEMGSPSKGGGGIGRKTPTRAGTKRKRSAQDSPVPLPLSLNKRTPVEAQIQVQLVDEVVLVKLLKEDDRFEVRLSPALVHVGWAKCTDW